MGIKMNEDFKRDLKRWLEQINVKISDEEINKFYKYMELLIEWNEKINLTAITEKKEVFYEQQFRF